MPTRCVRRSLLAALLAGSLVGLGGCGGNETGTQVEVDQKKADALTNSMAGYGGYAKKAGKSKGKSTAESAPASESAPKPAP